MIPNADARRDYIYAANRLLSVSESEIALYRTGLYNLIETGGIENLIQAFETLDRNRTGHSISHPEAGFHEGTYVVRSDMFTCLRLILGPLQHCSQLWRWRNGHRTEWRTSLALSFVVRLSISCTNR